MLLKGIHEVLFFNFKSSALLIRNVYNFFTVKSQHIVF